MSGANIEKLQEKVKIIMSLYTLLKEKNEVLEAKNYELEKQLTEHIQIKKELEQNYIDLQLAKAVSESNGETNEAKRKIEEIVREIDTCIALLNK